MRIYMDVCCLNRPFDDQSHERKTGVKVLASISGDKANVDEIKLRRASELEKIGLKALDALHLACVEKSAELMLTTDDDIVKTFRANNSLIKIRVENPVRWLMEVIENES